jgi:lipopolysaccharide export system protein LptA
MTAEQVDLFLTEAGDALERVEAYEAVTLREQRRKTTGSRMTYTASDGRYVVTGEPATVLDECGRETVGQKISFQRASDTVTVDGGTQRATTRGGTCS